jgi:hypothetical protein
MTIIQIPGKDNLVNLKNDPKLYYIVIVGALLATISFALTRDPLTLIFLILTTGTIFSILNRTPIDLVVKLNDNNLDIGESSLDWVNIDSWAAANSNEWLEIVIRSTHLTKPYFTFYIPQSHPKTQEFLVLLSERIAYDESVITNNSVHNILKKLGLR